MAFQKSEVAAMKLANSLLPSDSKCTVPKVYFYDESNHAFIMDDAGADSKPLKAFLMESPPDQALALEIGTALGEFIGRLHSYGRKDPERILPIIESQLGRTLTAWAYYSRIVSTLDGTVADADRLKASDFGVSAEDLHRIDELSKAKHELVMTSNETWTHGDFWTGNVAVTLRTEGDRNVLDKIYVFDWEVTKPGVAGFDIGQFSAELTLISHFMPSTPSDAAAREVLAGLLTAYEKGYPVDEALKKNAAVHLGSHFVSWGVRVPWGDREETKKLALRGVDLMLDQEKGAKWLWSSVRN
jgi:5-methylthioribose kinase